MNDIDSRNLGGGAPTASKLWGQVAPTAPPPRAIIGRITLKWMVTRRKAPLAFRQFSMHDKPVPLNKYLKTDLDLKMTFNPRLPGGPGG